MVLTESIRSSLDSNYTICERIRSLKFESVRSNVGSYKIVQFSIRSVYISRGTVFFQSGVLTQDRILYDIIEKYLKNMQNSITEIGCDNSLEFRNIELLVDCFVRSEITGICPVISLSCSPPSNLLKSIILYLVF